MFAPNKNNGKGEKINSTVFSITRKTLPVGLFQAMEQSQCLEYPHYVTYVVKRLQSHKKQDFAPA